MAYLLVIHGSRDPRPSDTARQLALYVAADLTSASALSPLVEVACLELASTPLHQQIVDFGDRAIQLSYSVLAIVPLFLLPGVHVREDIPEEVAIAQTILSNRIALQLYPHLGHSPSIVDVLALRLRRIARAVEHSKDLTTSMDVLFNSRVNGNRLIHSLRCTTHTILLAHGSRRAKGNQPIEAIATQIGAVPAYWSVSPTLDDQIQGLAVQEGERLIVLPYFLFSGAITDAIAERIKALSDRYPYLHIVLGQPLGEGQTFLDDLAQIIIRHITANTLTGK